jgi:hypothetical protein
VSNQGSSHPRHYDPITELTRTTTKCRYHSAQAQASLSAR